MCYFPTGAALRMCQSRVSGNDSEKRDGGRGRPGRQRPDFPQKAPDQWIGGRPALPGPINKHTRRRRLTARSTRAKKPETTEMKRLHLAGSIHGAPQQKPPTPPSGCHFDEWIRVTVN